MRSVLVFMVSNRGYHGSAKANRQITSAGRKQRRATKKGSRSHPGFCPTRRYSAMKYRHSGYGLAASANKSRVGIPRPAISSDNSDFRAAPLVQERRPVLF